MSRIRGRNTRPEIIVRSVLHGLGYRFRLHKAHLVGRPDIVLQKHRTVVFVHGCFWHGHDCARGARMPANNRDYWLAKIGRNVARDRTTLSALRKLGWSAHVIWECQTRDAGKLSRLIVRKLNQAPRTRT
jgi:DNA mismatch endonuclease (patch repair protein)